MLKICLISVDFTDSELTEVSEKFGIDMSIFNQRKDIEISSHYLKSNGQLSLIFQYPIIIHDPFKEEEIFIIIKKEVVFYFYPQR
jgi:magnesium transporter